jgi:hypothetical protein
MINNTGFSTPAHDHQQRPHDGSTREIAANVQVVFRVTPVRFLRVKIRIDWQERECDIIIDNSSVLLPTTISRRPTMLILTEIATSDVPSRPRQGTPPVSQRSRSSQTEDEPVHEPGPRQNE